MKFWNINWSLLLNSRNYLFFIFSGFLSAQGFTISPTEALITTEFGAADTLKINLNAQPSFDVRIPVSVSDSTEGLISVSDVIFTSSNWETVQNIVLTGQNDDEQDGDVSYALILSAAVSDDGSYNGLDPTDVSATNYDDDRVAIEVFPTEGIIVSERGNDGVISVRLDSKPTADVFVGLTSSNDDEGTVSPSSLTFSIDNWSDYQSVTVRGVSDGIADSDKIFSIIFFQAASEDQNYNGFDPPDVSVTNMNLDPPGINIYPTTGLATSEIGDKAKFNAVLLSAPNSNVTIGLSVSDSTEGSLQSSLLTFTPDNWDVPQAVTVLGKDDFDDDGDQNFSVTTIAALSDDPLYNGLDPADVSVTNVDEDGIGFTLYPIDTLSTSEDGKNAEFTFLLTSEPTSHVIVPVISSDPSEGSISPGWAVFKKNNWSKPQKLTVTGVNDDIADDDIRYTILVGPAESSDTNYEGLDPVDFFVTNRDNDSAYVLINPTSGLITTETGQQDTISLTLSARPRNDVIIPLSSSDSSEGKIEPDSVIIPVDSWADSFEAVVTGINDYDLDGDQLFTILTAPVVSVDYIFENINPPDIEVTNLDREPGLDLSLAVMHFDSVQVDTSAVISFSISNPGNDTLRITEMTLNTKHFTVLPEEAAVPDGDSITIAVIFSPDTIDTYRDTLTIVSNASKASHNIPLHGVGVTIDNLKPVISEVTHSPENPDIGTNIDISCTATDENGMLDVQISYHLGGSNVEKQLSMTSTPGGVYKISIPAEDVTINGLTYSIVAMDNRYNSTTTGPYSVNIGFSSSQFTSSMSGSALAGGIPLETWRMFSIPATLDDNNTNEVLNDELGKRGVTTWELWIWNANKWKYPSTLEPGKGYWLIQWVNPSVSIDPGSGVTVDQTGFIFTLEPGWNMIGNPYPFASDFNLKTGCGACDTLFYGPITYGWTGEGWSEESTLRPWSGYAIYNRSSTSEKITLNPEKISQVLAREKKPQPDGWKLNIGAYGKTYVDPDNAIGRLSGSSEELDYRDNPEPPYMGGYVSVVMPRSEWNANISDFTSDIRSLAEAEGVWDIQLRVKEETSPVTLSWDMEGDFPVEHDIVLLDLINRETHHIKENSSITFNQNWDKLPVYPFKVIAGTPEYVTSMTQEILSQLPETFTLHQNYPNPFNPSTTIGFEIPVPSQVSLRIYNLMGQEVRTLTHDWFSIGSHQLMWNGKDQRGIPVSAGVYIYRLQSQDFQKTRKMVLLK